MISCILMYEFILIYTSYMSNISNVQNYKQSFILNFSQIVDKISFINIF